MQGAAVAAAVVAVAAALAAAAAAPSSTAAPPDTRPQYDDTCMTCVCRANGKNGECVTDGKCVHGDTFGPFCISMPYWIDAGKPVLPGDDKNLPGAFRRCVEEPFCAVQTVRRYMETGPALQDCDKDGTITCRDLMLTHTRGRYNCKDEKDARVERLMGCLNASAPAPAPTPAPTVTPTPTPTPTRAPGRQPPGPSTQRQRPHLTTDAIHFPDGRALGSTGGGDDGNPLGHGAAAGYAPRFTFNTLHPSRPLGGGEDLDAEDGEEPFGPASRDIMTALSHNMRHLDDHMRDNMNRMQEHAQRMHLQAQAAAAAHAAAAAQAAAAQGGAFPRDPHWHHDDPGYDGAGAGAGEGPHGFK